MVSGVVKSFHRRGRNNVVIREVRVRELGLSAQEFHHLEVAFLRSRRHVVDEAAGLRFSARFAERGVVAVGPLGEVADRRRGAQVADRVMPAVEEMPHGVVGALEVVDQDAVVSDAGEAAVEHDDGDVHVVEPAEVILFHLGRHDEDAAAAVGEDLPDLCPDVHRLIYIRNIQDAVVRGALPRDAFRHLGEEGRVAHDLAVLSPVDELERVLHRLEHARTLFVEAVFLGRLQDQFPRLFADAGFIVEHHRDGRRGDAELAREFF